MKKRLSLLAIFCLGLTLIGVGESANAAGSVRDYFESWLQPTGCAFCGRQVHADMQVAFQKENEDTVPMACCLRCVITEAEQKGSSIRVLWVTDYITHERLRPDEAAYLVGSTINSDSGPLLETPWSRREQSELKWDRCLPSVIAFGKRDEALKFQQRAWGDIQTFRDLVTGTNVASFFQPVIP